MCKNLSDHSKQVILVNLVVVFSWLIILIGIKLTLRSFSSEKIEAYQSVVSNLLAFGAVITAAGTSIWSILSSTNDMRKATEKITENSNNALTQAKMSDLQAYELSRMTMALDMINKMSTKLEEESSKGLTPSLGKPDISLERYLNTVVLYINKLKVLYPKSNIQELPTVKIVSKIDDEFQICKKNKRSISNISDKLIQLNDIIVDLDREITEAIGVNIGGFEIFSFPQRAKK